MNKNNGRRPSFKRASLLILAVCLACVLFAQPVGGVASYVVSISTCDNTFTYGGSTEPTEPTEPTKPTAPTEPGTTAEPTKPTATQEPSTTGVPTQPTTATGVTEPGEQTQPTQATEASTAQAQTTVEPSTAASGAAAVTIPDADKGATSATDSASYDEGGRTDDRTPTKTGDRSNPWIYMVIMLACIAVIFYIWAPKNKENPDKAHKPEE